MIEGLLEQAELTDIPEVFKVKEPEIRPDRPLIVFVFGPSGVGKNTLAQPLLDNQILSFVTTATSRKKRPGESEDAYVWMRAKKDNESDLQYQENLIAEYGLLEHDFHDNALYGVPRESIEEALKANKDLLLIIEVNGVETISRQEEDRANLLRIFIAPESLEQLKDRIEREKGDTEIRYKKALEEMAAAPRLAHYILLNSEGQISLAQESLEKLVKRYILK